MQGWHSNIGRKVTLGRVRIWKAAAAARRLSLRSPFQRPSSFPTSAAPAAAKNSKDPSSSPLDFSGYSSSKLRFHLLGRGFASKAVVARGESLAVADDVPPVSAAIKNPTPRIVYDEYNHERLPPGSPSKRAFAYFVLGLGRFAYASVVRLLLVKLVLSMSATKDVLALASLEVDLSNIDPGSTATVKWRGKPVFIRRRTEEEIERANREDWTSLRDPQPDSARVKDPEWLVVVGVCTHLGCIPLPNAGDYGGWFCPCHGSHYDISGRARKGPAPFNLEVPVYTFLDERRLLIGSQ